MKVGRREKFGTEKGPEKSLGRGRGCVFAGSFQPIQPVGAYRTGCTVPSTFQKVHFSNSVLLSFAYLHRF
jgi:hypothetical protein